MSSELALLPVNRSVRAMELRGPKDKPTGTLQFESKNGRLIQREISYIPEKGGCTKIGEFFRWVFSCFSCCWGSEYTPKWVPVNIQVTQEIGRRGPVIDEQQVVKKVYINADDFLAQQELDDSSDNLRGQFINACRRDDATRTADVIRMFAHQFRQRQQ